MATEQKESDKKNKRSPKTGGRGKNKPVPAENQENQGQNKSDAAEAATEKPKAAPKAGKAPKKKAENKEVSPLAVPETAVVAEEPMQKKKGRPGRKPAKGRGKKPDLPEQKSAENPETQAGQKKEAQPAEAKPDVNVPKAEKETTASPAKAPQASGPKKKRGSGKKRGNQKALKQEATKALPEGTLAVGDEENEKTDASVSEKTSPEVVESPAAPVKEAPRKKKGRSKKSGKKKEHVPTPPPVAEEPIQVQENKVVIASRNPAKIKAVEIAYSRIFPGEEFIFESISVKGGVSEQPMSDDETFAGALYRAQAAQQEVQDAGYWIGLEGGIEEIGDELQAFGWMVVLSHDSKMGKARTSTFVLPYAVAELIRDGKELGEADDLVFGQTNSKLDQGAVGILTHGLIDRAHYYAEAVIMALIPFKNPEYYSTGSVESVETI